MKYIFLVISMLTLLSDMTYAKGVQFSVQVSELETKNTHNNRPIKLRIWYPEGLDRDCSNSQICLASRVQKNQAVLLMHGAMGSVKSHNWVGYAMASQGLVVVGIDHFGESWSYGVNTMNPSSVLNIDLRPNDVTSVLSQLSSNQLNSSSKPLFNIQVNWNNVTAVGHSSGGMAALLLAGAQADKKMALDYCKLETSNEDRSCSYTKDIQDVELKSKSDNHSFKDARIKRLITLDPAGGHLLTATSLKNIDLPLLVIGSQKNDFLPFTQHAKRYAALVPHAKLIALNNGEGHFVYLDKCSHTHKAMGISLCEDREGVSRQTVHEKLYPEIFRFIYSNQ